EVARSCQNTLSRSLTSVIRAQRRCPRQRLGVFFWAGGLILITMGLFIAFSPIKRRHTRQRIAEKPSRQVARLELGSAGTIPQRQGTRPSARGEAGEGGAPTRSSLIQDR